MLNIPTPDLPLGYSVELNPSMDLLDDIGRLRIIAWRNEKGINPVFFDKESWIEEYDRTFQLWCIMYNNEIVASARLSTHYKLDDVPYYSLFCKMELPEIKFPMTSLNRLVVHPNHRGKGLAKILDTLRIKASHQLGAKMIIAEPQDDRVHTFEKYGFKMIGKLAPPIEMPDRDVFLMYMEL